MPCKCPHATLLTLRKHYTRTHLGIWRKQNIHQPRVHLQISLCICKWAHWGGVCLEGWLRDALPEDGSYHHAGPRTPPGSVAAEALLCSWLHLLEYSSGWWGLWVASSWGWHLLNRFASVPHASQAFPTLCLFFDELIEGMIEKVRMMYLWPHCHNHGDKQSPLQKLPRDASGVRLKSSILLASSEIPAVRSGCPGMEDHGVGDLSPPRPSLM